eukprot:220792-Amphidinium_carterae.1
MDLAMYWWSQQLSWPLCGRWRSRRLRSRRKLFSKVVCASSRGGALLFRVVLLLAEVGAACVQQTPACQCGGHAVDARVLVGPRNTWLETNIDIIIVVNSLVNSVINTPP